MVMATFARKYPGGELVLPTYIIIRYVDLRKSLIHYTYTANVCARVVGEEMDCDYTGQRSDCVHVSQALHDVSAAPAYD